MLHTRQQIPNRMSFSTLLKTYICPSTPQKDVYPACSLSASPQSMTISLPGLPAQPRLCTVPSSNDRSSLVTASTQTSTYLLVNPMIELSCHFRALPALSFCKFGENPSFQSQTVWGPTRALSRSNHNEALISERRISESLNVLKSFGEPALEAPLPVHVAVQAFSLRRTRSLALVIYCCRVITVVGLTVVCYNLTVS